jgi:MFS family permease
MKGHDELAPKILPASSAKPTIFYGYIIVGVAFLIMAISWGSRNAFGVFFNPVLTEFGWNRAMTSGAFSLHMIAGGLISGVMGGFADRHGPRLITTVSCLLLAAGFLLMAWINSVWQLYCFWGIIAGIGMAGTRVPLSSTVARWFTKRRNTMTGIVLAGTGIGALVLPPLANWVISAYGWRISFLVLGAVILVIAGSTTHLLRRDPATMGQMPFGDDQKVSQKSKHNETGATLSQALRTRQFWLVWTMFFFFGYCMYSTMVHIAPEAMEKGISSATAASLIATIGGTGILARFTLGSAADRIGNKWTFIIGFVLIAAAYVELAFASGIWMFFVFAAIFGFAQGGMGTSESPLIANLFGLSSHGKIYGTTAIGFTAGAAVGPFLSGYIFDLTGSYQFALVACIICSIIGLILTTLITPIKGKQDSSVRI